MSKKKVFVLVVEFALFLLPALALLWTAILFGASHEGVLVVLSSFLFIIGLAVIAATSIEMD